MKSKKNPAIPQNGSFQNEELPEGWTEVPLSRILLTLESGSRPKGGVRGIETGIPSVGGEHLDDRGGFRFENIKYIPMSFFENMRRGRIQTDDILIVKDGATTGKVSLVRTDFPYNPAMVNEHVFVCRFIEGIYSPFVFYFLFSQVGQNRILENFQGSAQGGINQTFAENTIVPIAPFAEQQRIVARVEALLTQVNAARDRLSRVPLIMKRFRQAVLAAACSGRLTEGWREDNSQIPLSTEALNAFFRSVRDDSSLKIIQKRSKDSETNPDFEWSFEIPESWCWATLEKLAALEKNSITDGPFGSNLKTEHYSQSGPRVIRLQNIGEGSFIDVKTHISQSHFNILLKHEIFSGDIAIGLLGDPIPRSCIIPAVVGPAIVKADCIRFKPNPDLALTEFLSYAINEPELRSQATESVHGVARPRLNLTQIKNFFIPLPPLAEQHEIVRRVGLLFERADAIDREVAAAGRRCERLTQAVLARAFAGKL